MTVIMMAGFECAHLPWNGHDLLVSTRHTPEADMARHYELAAEHGCLAARDGLPWRHDPGRRISTARRAVVWDLAHYDVPPDPYAHGAACARAVDPDRPFWICPVNEPMLYPRMSGVSVPDALALAGALLRGAEDHHGDVRVLTTDPIVGAAGEYRCVDVLAERADIIGCNLYPHTLQAPIHAVLLETWRRHGKPVIISETSWHCGHEEQARRFPEIRGKGDWLRHVRAEVLLARRAGADVRAICWYPMIDCPTWDDPTRGRWSHGLIREDLSVDSSLAAELAPPLAD